MNKPRNTILFLLSNNVIQMGIGFFKAFIMIHTLGAFDYGRLQFLFAVFAITDIVISSIDIISSRFLAPDVSNRNDIVWANLILKSTNYMFFLILGLTLYYTLGPSFYGDASTLTLILGFILAYFRAIRLSLSAFLSAFEKYYLVNIMITLESFTMIFLVGFLYFVKLPVELYFNILFAISIISCLILIFVIGKHLKNFKPEILHFPKNSVIGIIKKGILNYRSYFLPMLATNFSGYLKRYAPTYLLGINSEFQTATYFEILKKMYDTIGKLGPGIIQYAIPTISRIFESDTSKVFFKKWLKYVILFFGLMTFLGLVLQLFGQTLFYIYGIKSIPGLSWVIFIMNLQLIFLTWAHSTQSLALVQKKTQMIMFASVLRQIIYVLCLVYFSQSLSLLNLSYTVVISLAAVVAYETIWFIRTFKGFAFMQALYASFAVFQLGVYYCAYLVEPYFNLLLKRIIE